MKDWLSICNENKRKNLVPYINHLLYFSVLLLTISLQLIARCSYQVLSIFSCLHFNLMHYICSFTCQGTFENCEESGKSRFGCFEKYCYFFKIPKWQHELVPDDVVGKLDFYFPNNAAKICLYGLKISGNIEMEHCFQFKAFFHLSSNLHTCCLIAFKEKKSDLVKNIYHVITRPTNIPIPGSLRNFKNFKIWRN